MIATLVAIVSAPMNRIARNAIAVRPANDLPVHLPGESIAPPTAARSMNLSASRVPTGPVRASWTAEYEFAVILSNTD
jgi:hypothetical protein